MIRNYMCIYSFVQKRCWKIKLETGETSALEVGTRNGMEKWGREKWVRSEDGTFPSRSLYKTVILRTTVMLYVPLENRK